jgi:hypothetical protein
MRFYRTPRLFKLAAAFVLIAGPFSTAQEANRSSPSDIEAGRIPVDALLFATVQPNRLSKAPGMEFMPIEVATAAGLEYVGFDPIKIERIDAAMGFNPVSGPTAAAMVTLSEPFDLKNLKNSPFATAPESGANGLEIYPAMDPNLRTQGIILAGLDNRRYIVGSTPYVERMAKVQKPTGRVALLAQDIKTVDEISAIFDFGTIRPMAELGWENTRNDIPPAFQVEIDKLIANLEMVAIRWGERSKFSIQTMLSAEDESRSTALEESLQSMKQTGLNMFLDEMRRASETEADNSQIPERVRKAIVQYVERMMVEADKTLSINRRGTRVLVNQETRPGMQQMMHVQTIGILAGLLLPAVQQARETARRMSCSNNLRNLGLALLNYENTFKSLPPAAIVDKANGAPLLSWRVAVLPFIEENELYKEFHLDEPWDSPHNIKLLDKMPSVFRCPTQILPPGETSYLAVVGNEFALRKDSGRGLGSILDGTSNTILIVEAGRGQSVPWTAPEDFTPQQADPISGLVPSWHAGGFHTVLADCSVRFIAADISPKILWGLFTCDGGEVGE